MPQRADRGFDHPIPSEITPRAAYEGRRAWMKQLAAGALGTGLAAWAGREALAQAAPTAAALAGGKSAVAGALTMEKATPRQDVTTYNNYYEFGTDKSDPARNAHTLKTRPWTVSVEGEVKKPKVYGLEELLKLAPMEERIYRLRCVEGWSMVIPWVGWSLNELIKQVEPTGNAKYVEFHTLADPKTMPFVGSRVLEGEPYVPVVAVGTTAEGDQLRCDPATGDTTAVVAMPTDVGVRAVPLAFVVGGIAALGIAGLLHPRGRGIRRFGS